MTDVRPIRTEAGYEAALAEVARLWGAPAGTPEGDRLDVLATLIDAYESERDRWTRPTRSTPRMEQQRLSRKDLEGDRHPLPGRRGPQPPPRPVDHHDPPPARPPRRLGRSPDPPDPGKVEPGGGNRTGRKVLDPFFTLATLVRFLPMIETTP